MENCSSFCGEPRNLGGVDGNVRRIDHKEKLMGKLDWSMSWIILNKPKVLSSVIRKYENSNVFSNIHVKHL